jgi:hypothetical protein
MPTQQIAIVPEGVDISLGEVDRVAAALQKQATRDFDPIWNVSATVDAFSTLDDVPLGYWPVLLVQDVPGAAGIHLDENGQPFALVEIGNSWSLTASHEVLEMLADSFGNRLVASQSPKPDQGRVEILVEVCDPPEDPQFAYRVNNVLVSDFYTPEYFDPVTRQGVTYSFTGSISEPRQVLSGGYLSWHNPVDDHWWQLTFFGPAPRFRDLGVLTRGEGSLRAMIDARTPQTRRLSKLSHDQEPLAATLTSAALAQESTVRRAESLRSQIARLVETSADADPARGLRGEEGDPSNE